MARTKLLLLGAAVVAAGVLLKRDKVVGLLPGRGQTYEPPAPPPPPAPSNYDAPGPVANTATPVPAPDPQEPEAIDEAAEEAAAAAEAANIGGVVSDYAGLTGQPATEEERPLAEAGEGEAEGQEQAEHDLEVAAEPTAPGVSDAERAIDDAIDQAANPLAGEQIESPGGWSPPVPERSDDPAPFEEQATEVQGEQTQFEPPTTPQEPAASDESPAEDEKKDDEDGGSDWRTWSGRSVNP